MTVDILPSLPSSYAFFFLPHLSPIHFPHFRTFDTCHVNSYSTERKGRDRFEIFRYPKSIAFFSFLFLPRKALEIVFALKEEEEEDSLFLSLFFYQLTEYGISEDRDISLEIWDIKSSPEMRCSVRGSVPLTFT